VKRLIRTLVLALAVVTAARAAAQHATASDIEGGGRAFESSCAACHGPDGNLIAGIDFGRGVFRRPLTDDELVDIVMQGIPNTPMPAMPGMSKQQAVQIVAYLRSLPESFVEAGAIGDVERGRQIFAGTGRCLDCHAVAGRGSRLGPGLSRIGLDRRAAQLELALLDPDAEVQPTHRYYTVTPKRGAPVTGRLLNHDSFTVQLMDADQRLRLFRKSELRDFGFTSSPMPSYRDSLDTQALADVVSYLVSLRGEAAL
jgi:putative heme-binding domain-containing protein